MSTADPSALAQGAKETLSACAHRLAQTSGGKLVVLGPQDWHAVIALEQAIFPEDPWTPGMVAEDLSSGLSVYFGVCADAPQGELPVLCGYAGVKVGLDSDVMTMGVLPDFRGRGCLVVSGGLARSDWPRNPCVRHRLMWGLRIGEPWPRDPGSCGRSRRDRRWQSISVRR